MSDHPGDDDDHGPHVRDEDLRLLMFDDHFAHLRVRAELEGFVRGRRWSRVREQDVQDVVSHAVSETFHLIRDAADPREIRQEMRRAVDRKSRELSRRAKRVHGLEPGFDAEGGASKLNSLIEQEYARRVIEVAETEMAAALASLRPRDRERIADAYGIFLDGRPPKPAAAEQAAHPGQGPAVRHETAKKALQRARERFSRALELRIERLRQAGRDEFVLSYVLAFVRGLRTARIATLRDFGSSSSSDGEADEAA